MTVTSLVKLRSYLDVYLRRCHREPRNVHVAENAQWLPARGSTLLMCLILLSTLSTAALAALEVAWSGQRMVAAYIHHQQAFMQAEQQLLVTEREIWQYIDDSGLEAWLAQQDADDLSQINVDSSWLDQEFSVQACGLLFGVEVAPAEETGSKLRLASSWQVCCENRLSCMQAQFTQIQRQWSLQ